MKISRGLLIASALLAAPHASACQDMLPTKNVVSQAQVVFTGTVERVTIREPDSQDDENPQTLHIRLAKKHKGSPSKLTLVKTNACGVPHWRAGARVLVIVLPRLNYFVVAEQPLLGR